MKSANTGLVEIGRRLFPFRLVFGIIIAVIALGWIVPQPLFFTSYWVAQLAGILLVLFGLALRAWGSGTAGTHTRSNEIEAPTLITGGPFAYLRNPIYGGSLVLGFGMAMLIGDPWAFVFAGAAFLVLYCSIIPAEEKFLAKQFGDDYFQYRQNVPRLLPRLRPWENRSERSFDWRGVVGEWKIIAVLIGIYAALWFEEYLDVLGIS